MKVIWSSGFPDIYAQLEVGGGFNLPWVYVNSAIYETYLGVVVFHGHLLLN